MYILLCVCACLRACVGVYNGMYLFRFLGTYPFGASVRY